MQLFRHAIPAAALAAVFILPAAAQTIRPGQWEITNRITGGSGANAGALAEAQKQLANLPADQRKMVEAMLARQGVTMSGNGDGIKLTHCVTKEMAEKKELPAGQQGDCTSSNTPIAGGMNVSFSCSKPPSSGKGQVLFQGDSAYTMRMNITATVQGKQETMTVDSTGRLLSPQCTGK